MKLVYFLLLASTVFSFDADLFRSDEPYVFYLVDQERWIINEIYLGGGQVQYKPSWIQQVLNLKREALEQAYYDPMLAESNFVPTLNMEDMGTDSLTSIRSLNISNDGLRSMNSGIKDNLPSDNISISSYNSTVTSVADGYSVSYGQVNSAFKSQKSSMESEASKMFDEYHDAYPSNSTSNETFVYSLISADDIDKVVKFLEDNQDIDTSKIENKLNARRNQNLWTDEDIQDYFNQVDETAQDYNKDDVISYLESENDYVDELLETINTAINQGDSNQDLTNVRDSLMEYSRMINDKMAQRIISKYNLVKLQDQQATQLASNITSKVEQYRQYYYLLPGYTYRFVKTKVQNNQNDFMYGQVQVESRDNFEIWVRVVEEYPPYEIEIYKYDVSLNKYQVTSNENVTLQWYGSSIMGDIVYAYYEVAPLLQLNNPSDCFKTLSWYVTGNVTGKSDWVDIVIPYTAQNVTFSYVLLTIQTEYYKYSVVKPLLVYKSKDQQQIQQQLNNLPSSSDVEDDQVGAMNALFTANQQVNQLQGADESRRFLATDSDEIEYPDINYQRYMDRDEIENMVGDMADMTNEMARDNTYTIGDAADEDLRSPHFQQCRDTNVIVEYRPVQITSRLQGRFSQSANLATNTQGNKIPQNIMNAGCPPDSSCSGNGVCEQINDSEEPRQSVFKCQCFEGYYGRSCSINEENMRTIKNTFLKGVELLKSVDLSKETNQTAQQQLIQVYLQNLQLMTTNELATGEGLETLVKSIKSNIAELATSTHVNQLASCAYNLKQQYVFSQNNTGVQQVRQLIDLTLATLSTNISQQIDTHIDVGDFKGLQSAILSDSTSSYSMTSTIDDPITNNTLSYPSAVIPKKALAGGASSVSLSIQDCSYYPDVECANPVVQLTLRDKKGKSVAVSLDSGDDTYEIGIPVYKTDFSKPKYTCQWIKTNKDGSTSIQTNGCSVISVEDNLVKCACTHLTEFTVKVTSESTPTAFASTEKDNANGKQILSLLILVFMMLFQQ